MALRRLTAALTATSIAAVSCSAQAHLGHPTSPPATTQTVVIATTEPPQLTDTDRMRIMVDELRHSNAPWLADVPDRQSMVDFAHRYCDSNYSYDKAAEELHERGGSWTEVHAILDAAMTAFCPSRPISPDAG
ncbi:DUF732 domain-containing protein [Mycobacterium marinum]|uniref:DUF732 domain-containing protein n=1 Tax=Mycobacterium marinum TaxID=1781 RepID=UPI0023427245|nr:DUF732 domain-containing protein [Mycobacterium marinum]MDC8992491.1 DUF732 domain-containing protein [Mycobacterium marinum]WDZ15792.1 DUF732 domain-containing protein [Mycobacterium marinum]